MCVNMKVGSLLPQCGFWGKNLVYQALWQAPSLRHGLILPLGAIIYELRGDSSTHNMESPLSWGCPKLLGWVDVSLCLANNPSLLESPERGDSLSLGFKTLPF